jgi:hypothetical protein
MSRKILTIGWITVLFSIIIIFLEVTSLFENPSMGEMDSLIRSLPQVQAALDSMNDMSLYSRIWSIYMILYFCGVLIGAVQFVRYQETGRKILEIACWVGCGNAGADSYLSYIQLKNMQAAFSAAIKTAGGGLDNLFLFGMIPIILGFFLWIIPSIGIIVYLRKSELKALMKKSTADTIETPPYH